MSMENELVKLMGRQIAYETDKQIIYVLTGKYPSEEPRKGTLVNKRRKLSVAIRRH